MEGCGEEHGEKPTLGPEGWREMRGMGRMEGMGREPGAVAVGMIYAGSLRTRYGFVAIQDTSQSHPLSPEPPLSPQLLPAATS